MTINIYLNDVPKENRGDIRVLASSTLEDFKAGRALKVLGKVQPVLGSAAVFRGTNLTPTGCSAWMCTY